MKELIAVIVMCLVVAFVWLYDDGFKQRWCATYPDWCMPVSADDSSFWGDQYAESH